MQYQPRIGAYRLGRKVRDKAEALGWKLGRRQTDGIAKEAVRIEGAWLDGWETRRAVRRHAYEACMSGFERAARGINRERRQPELRIGDIIGRGR